MRHGDENKPFNSNMRRIVLEFNYNHVISDTSLKLKNTSLNINLFRFGSHCRIKGIYEMLGEQSKLLQTISQQKQAEEESRQAPTKILGKVSSKLIPSFKF